MQPSRHYLHWVLDPPFPSVFVFKERMNSETLWSVIREYADIATEGRGLFSGSYSVRNRYWQEFRNYVRQARVYHDAALTIRGSSAALPYYYSALNLAKSELLIKHPTAVYQRRIGHGLSYNPTNARSLAGDYITVGEGVFREVYRLRTGYQLPVGTRLWVKRLLLQCHEIGWEVNKAGMGHPRASSGMHAVVSDDTHIWPMVALESNRNLPDSGDVAGRQFLRYLRPVQHPSRWRDHFGITRRVLAPDLQFYEWKVPLELDEFDSMDQAFSTVGCAFHEELGRYLEAPDDPAFEFQFLPGLYRSRHLDMPSSLARYALVFYASSLVRYRPSALDPQDRPRQAWLIDAFIRQSWTLLLWGSVNAMQNSINLFVPESVTRR